MHAMEEIQLLARHLHDLVAGESQKWRRNSEVTFLGWRRRLAGSNSKMVSLKG